MNLLSVKILLLLKICALTLITFVDTNNSKRHNCNNLRKNNAIAFKRHLRLLQSKLKLFVENFSCIKIFFGCFILTIFF